jgi:hypothetical protein
MTPHRGRIVSLEAAPEDEAGSDGTFGTRVLGSMRQALCGLHGHDNLLQFEECRVFLRCASCGHESPGWELGRARPAVRQAGDSRRHVLARSELIGARRIA